MVKVWSLPPPSNDNLQRVPGMGSLDKVSPSWKGGSDNWVPASFGMTVRITISVRQIRWSIEHIVFFNLNSLLATCRVGLFLIQRKTKKNDRADSELSKESSITFLRLRSVWARRRYLDRFRGPRRRVTKTSLLAFAFRFCDWKYVTRERGEATGVKWVGNIPANVRIVRWIRVERSLRGHKKDSSCQMAHGRLRRRWWCCLLEDVNWRWENVVDDVFYEWVFCYCEGGRECSACLQSACCLLIESN